MNWTENSSLILAFSLPLLWVIGFFLMTTARRAKDKSATLIALSAIAFFLVILSVDFFFFSRDFAGAQKIWSRGWIGQHDLPGAITIGILEDSLGLVISILSCGLALALLSSRGRSRVAVGALFGVSGVSLAWLSSTPWLSFLGLGITTLSGFVALGTSQTDAKANQIAQYGRERTFGLMFAVLGTVVLAGQRAALSLDHSFSLPPQNLGAFFDWAGGACLMIGLYLHLQPFPFLGWLAESIEEPSSVSILLNQIFPALAAFSVLIRFEPEIRATGVLEVFGIYALASSFLAVLSGLSHAGWKKPLSLWLSAALSFAVTALCWAGPAAAILVLVSTVISALALALLGDVKEKGFTHASAQVATILAVISAGGMIGFLGASGSIRFLASLSSDPVRASFAALVLLANSFLLWKAGWSILRIRNSASHAEKEVKSKKENPVTVTAVYLLCLISLGIFWTGAISGGVLPHDPDLVLPSWLRISVLQAFSTPLTDWADDPNSILGQSMAWSVAVIAAMISFWVAGRQEDHWVGFMNRSEKFGEFLKSGYRLDSTGAKVIRVLNTVGGGIEKFVAEKLSEKWLPALAAAAIRTPARWIDNTDLKIYHKSNSILKRSIETPGKLLQLIQNGDVQWYLFFGLSCILALLIHFSRV